MGHTNFVELRAAGILKDRPTLTLVDGSGNKYIHYAGLETIPQIDMPATFVIGSDQYAGKLTAVSPTKHRVTWMRFENGVPTLGFTVRLSRRANGEYRQVGSNHGYLKLGVAKTNLDAGF